MTKRPLLKKLFKHTDLRKKIFPEGSKILKSKENGRYHGKSKEIFCKNINCI